jgi:hypothetical protein
VDNHHGAMGGLPPGLVMSCCADDLRVDGDRRAGAGAAGLTGCRAPWYWVNKLLAARFADVAASRLAVLLTLTFHAVKARG